MWEATLGEVVWVLAMAVLSQEILNTPVVPFLTRVVIRESRIKIVVMIVSILKSLFAKLNLVLK